MPTGNKKFKYTGLTDKIFDNVAIAKLKYLKTNNIPKDTKRAVIKAAFFLFVSAVFSMAIAHA